MLRSVNLRYKGRLGLRLTITVVGAVALVAAATALAGGARTAALKPGAGLSGRSTTIVANFTKDTGGRGRLAPTKDGMTSVIVKLNVDGVADYKGGVAGFARTAPTGGPLDLKSAAAQAYLSYVDNAETSFANSVRAALPGSSLTYKYDVGYGGVAMIVPANGISAIAKLPNVVSVQRDTLQHADTDHSPAFIGATTIWSALGDPLLGTPRNEIVADIDTGIWPEHPSFSPTPNDGTNYAIPAPPPPISGVRQCQFSGGANPGPAFACNNKLIAAQRFMSTYDSLIAPVPGEYTSARDDEGHGTHTASTAAGDGNVPASILGTSRGVVSGIDPRAHLMAYKALGVQGGFSSDLAAAAQKAITDGANAINYSISGGANPYSDAVEQMFLSAYNAGVFVSASAGNSGPALDTTDHRSPWDTTVGASTEDRSFDTTAHLAASDGAQLNLKGVSVAMNSPGALVVYAGNAPYNDPLCLVSTADGAFTGKIVVCKRGTNGRAEKGFNVKARGAVGMILINTLAPSQDLETDNHWLPAIHVDTGPGATLLAFLAAHATVGAQWNSGSPATSPGDVMAAFSSRGGPGQSIGISKPDVTAPGVQILAGMTPTPLPPPGGVADGPSGQYFQAIAGTSMSAPHVTGAGALLKAEHPTWTPGQIHSALMTTAKLQNVLEEDGVTQATPFDDGSGRIDLTRAGDPGITFDETGANYSGYSSHPQDLYMANYPSVYIKNIPGIVTVQRTAHSVLGSASTWTFSSIAQPGLTLTTPVSIGIAAGGNTTFSITIDASALPLGAVRFGYVQMVDNNGHKAVMPITIVRGQAGVTLDKTCSPTSIVLGGLTHCSITAQNLTPTAATVTIDDTLPSKLSIVAGSINGATQSGNGVHYSGSLSGQSPPGIAVTPCAACSPAGAYLPLSSFGVPVTATGDDVVVNFSTPGFIYGGQTYTALGVSSNGLAKPGGATAPDASITNQNLPNAATPNNVVAPFWTDLNPGAAAAGDGVRVGTLTNGTDSWVVVDFQNVAEFSTPANKHSFQIWFGYAADANPVDDVTYVYGPTTGSGDGGFLTNGAENSSGTSGTSIYYNGVGVLPANGQNYKVTGTPPATGGSHTITFDALGVAIGAWRNCATMTSTAFTGTSFSCVDGDVH